MRSKTNLNIDGLKAIRSRISKGKKSAILNTARAIANDAAENAPKDTEYLVESIHITTRDYSEYPISVAASTDKFNEAVAVGRTPKGRFIGPKSNYKFFPEQKPENDNEAWVVVGAQHGIFQEKNFQGRKPFLLPAVYKNRTRLTEEIRLLFDGLSVKGKITPYNSGKKK